MEGIGTLKKPKASYGGWVVMMRVHPCNVLGEPEVKMPRFVYKCRHLTSTTLVVEAPSLDFADVGHDDEIIRDMLNNRNDGEVIMDGLDNSRSDIEARMDAEHNPMTGKMQYHLLFPDHCNLDETVLEKHSKMSNGELKMEPLPYARTVTRLAPKKQSTGASTTTSAMDVDPSVKFAATRIFWRVADLNKESQKKGRADRADEHDDDAFASDFMDGVKIS